MSERAPFPSPEFDQNNRPNRRADPPEQPHPALAKEIAESRLKQKRTRREFLKSMRNAGIGMGATAFGAKLFMGQAPQVIRHSIDAEAQLLHTDETVADVPTVQVEQSASETETFPDYNVRQYVEHRVGELPSVNTAWVRQTFGNGDLDNPSGPELSLSMGLDADGYVELEYQYPGLKADEFILYLQADDVASGRGILVPCVDGRADLSSDLELQALFNNGNYQVATIQAVVQGDNGELLALASSPPDIPNSGSIKYIPETQFTGTVLDANAVSGTDSAAVVERQPVDGTWYQQSFNAAKSVVRHYPEQVVGAGIMLPAAMHALFEIEDALIEAEKHRSESERIKTRIRAFNIFEAAMQERDAQGPSLDLDDELKAFEAVPRRLRLDKLQSLKREYILQRYAVSSLERDMLDMAERENLDEAALRQRVYQRPQWRILTEYQREVAENAIRVYGQRHARVEQLRAAHPEDNELFKAIFTREPFGKVVIKEGPITLNVRCYDLRDYTIVRKQHWVHGGTEIPGEADLEEANRSGGSYLTSFGGIITVEKCSGKSHSEHELAVVEKHEKRHALNSLLKAAAEGPPDHSDEFMKALDALALTQNIAEQQQLARRALMLYRFDEIDPQAWDELLAYSSEESNKVEFVMATLTKPAAKGGLYDFAVRGQTGITKTLQLIQDRAPGLDDVVLKEIVHQVFVEDYHKQLLRALLAVSQVRVLGLNNEEALGELAQEELHVWPRVPARIKDFLDERAPASKRRFGLPWRRSPDSKLAA